MNALNHSTVVAALIHYALHVADPQFCIDALNEVSPDPQLPWKASITTARRNYRELLDRAEVSA